MPLIQPDTSNMTDFEASRPDTYLGTIVLVEPVVGKEKGTKGIQPSIEFDAPRLADGEVRKVNRRAWLATEGKGTFGFDQLLRCVGLGEQADAIKNGGGRVGFDTDALVGKQVKVVLTNEQYQGKLQDSIQSFLPPN